MKYVIYKATNTINNKSYIGFTSRWPKRMKEHLKAATWNNHYSKNSHFYRAIRMYGQDAFVWEILKESDNKELMSEEENFIKEFDSKLNGYNMTDGGEGALGVKLTLEQKQKMSESRKGRIPWNKGLRGVTTAWNKGLTGVIKYPKRKSSSNKGKTYEEIYGPEKARELKELRSARMSISMTGRIPHNKRK